MIAGLDETNACESLSVALLNDVGECGRGGVEAAKESYFDLFFCCVWHLSGEVLIAKSLYISE